MIEQQMDIGGAVRETGDGVRKAEERPCHVGGGLAVTDL